MSLDSKHVSDSKTLHEFETRGKEQFESFKQKMCDEQLYSTIKSFDYKKRNKQLFPIDWKYLTVRVIIPLLG